MDHLELLFFLDDPGFRKGVSFFGTFPGFRQGRLLKVNMILTNENRRT